MGSSTSSTDGLELSNPTLEKSACWLTMGGTKITSVTIGDVNGDGKLEIVTGGSYFDGILWNAQLIVRDASSLTL